MERFSGIALLVCVIAVSTHANDAPPQPRKSVLRGNQGEWRPAQSPDTAVDQYADHLACDSWTEGSVDEPDDRDDDEAHRVVADRVQDRGHRDIRISPASMGSEFWGSGKKIVRLTICVKPSASMGPEF